VYSRYIDVEIDWLRDMIRGKIIFRKCPDCDKDGLVFFDENGQNASPNPRPEWGENYDSSQCETCEGLGYLESARED
jgi:hypothetical protein